MYRPLPLPVTIKPSNIEGLGLFSIMNIPMGYNLGITHIKDDRFENGYSRTPLGGFFNHSSNNPNCEVIYKGDFVYLQTLREIKEGEEITAKYTFYNPDGKV